MSGIGRPLLWHVTTCHRRTRASPLGAFVGSNPTVYTIFNQAQKEASMKKAIVLLSLLAFNVAYASPLVSNDPTKMYDLRKGTNRTMTIEWRTVKEPLKVCNAESKRLGNNGFAYTVQACAFWTQTHCTIITGETDNHDSIGHEFRHCFQGHWHSQ